MLSPEDSRYILYQRVKQDRVLWSMQTGGSYYIWDHLTRAERNHYHLLYEKIAAEVTERKITP